MPKYDPVREAHEIRAQLSSDKRRLAFFLGAGTSQAVGIEGIVQLTTGVQADLTGQRRRRRFRVADTRQRPRITTRSKQERTLRI